MHGRWRIGGRFGQLEVARRGQLAPGTHPAPHSHALFNDLAALLVDPLGHRVLLEMYESVYGQSPGWTIRRAAHHEFRRSVIPLLVDAFRRGELVVVGTGAALTASASVPAAATEEPAEAEHAPTDNLTWIEIELFDQDDEPVANQRYVITLPDGSQRSGSTNAQGFARVANIDPGTCKVAFPDIDAREWQAA